MGFVYEVGTSRSGRRTRVLCCDVCDHAGGVRRVACRYGYCQSAALCASCRRDPAVRARLEAYCEENCREASAVFAALERRRVELLEAGEFVRVSALGCIGVDKVAVTFQNRVGAEAFAEMTRAEYAAGPLGVPATPADFGRDVVAAFATRAEV